MDEKLTDAELLAAMVMEMSALDSPLTLVLQPESALMIAAMLQLALRHPELGTTNARFARTWLEHVRAYFSQAPAVLEVLRRGDDPQFDDFTPPTPPKRES